jgi:hypothetical protein
MVKGSGDGEFIGSYGGHPRGIRGNLWPRCAVCGAPMCHMMQVDAGPSVDLGGYERLSVFICHATGGRCEDWNAHNGANKVLLHAEKDDTLYDGPPTVRVYRRTRLIAGEPVDELDLMRRVKAGEVTMTQALSSIKHDKVGGGAVWLQGEATPKSKTGEGNMRLAVQFTTNIVSFDITPGGMGYIFLDPNDVSPESAYFMWQSG